MNIYLIIVCFVLIAVMNAIQRICSKVSSKEINGNATFLRFGALYQLFAAILSLITLFIVGFNGWNLPTILCSLIFAVCFAVNIFSGIEAIKNCSLVTAYMFSIGGLILSIVVSYFWFNEAVSVWQIIGLIMFFVSAYLLSSEQKNVNKKCTAYTVFMLILSFLSNGVVMVVQKYFTLRVKNGNVALFSFLSFLFCAAVLYISLLFVLRPKKRKTASTNAETETAVQGKKKFVFLKKSLIVCSILLALSIFAINYLITEMGRTVSSMVLFPVSASIGILVTTVVGAVVFKEKLSLKNSIGLILGLLSIIVISLLTPANIAL
jgi:drug/metabolite transporter (DMT)-like permease